MQGRYKLTKLTNSKWANLYKVDYQREKPDFKGDWTMCSRKERPIEDARRPDAVVIIPFVDTLDGLKLLVTKEFRIPIWDYEFGFPAGLIEPGEDVETTVKRELKEETGLTLTAVTHVSNTVYSSAGLTDESNVMVMVRAQGQPTAIHLKGHEDIESFLMTPPEVADLLKSGKKIAAKAWGLLYSYARAGTI